MAMLSIVAGVQEYVQAMVARVSGMKVLVLDAETLGIMSIVFSQSDILKHEVFLTELIDSDHFFNEEKMRHMNAICFLRPTDKNFVKLCKELKDPKYNEYYVFFTNVVPHPRLEQLACCDEHEVVQQVQEFFADVFAVGHDVFSLNLQSTARLTQEQRHWNKYDETILDRTIEGLLSVCLTLRVLPALRYTSGSELTRLVAHRLQARLGEEKSLFDSGENIERERAGVGGPVLLLLDRRNDPVTPLLNQWTYQAMVHELLTLENNKVDLSRVPGIRKELELIVMSSTQDEFFAENMYANYGELCQTIGKYVEDYQKQTKNSVKIDSIEDMQRFVDAYPEFRRLSGNVSKHVAVAQELSRIIQTNGLFEASHLEQELACSENRQEHFRQLTEMLRGTGITNMERLRLVLLYTLRYESHESSIAQLKELLRASGIAEDQIGLVDELLRYAGGQVRNGDLFQNKSLLTMARNVVTSSFKDVESVYTQHKSQLASTADSLMRGKLKEATYPFFDGRSATTSREQVSKAIIFIVGGATFEEAKDIAEINRSLTGGRSIILGGTTIHNSRSFLTDIAQLKVGSGPE